MISEVPENARYEIKFIAYEHEFLRLMQRLKMFSSSYRLLCAAAYAVVMLLWQPAIARGTPLEAQEMTKENGSFSFVVWGHPKSGGHVGLPALHIEEILERINELQPDMLFITGDMISGRVCHRPGCRLNTDAELLHRDWDAFDADLQELNIPVYRLPGNHDVNDYVSRDVYLERYAKPPYAITFSDSRFVLLDSRGIDLLANDDRPYWGSPHLPFSTAQLDFIRDEIANQDNYQHMFFFMHHSRPWARTDGFWWEDVNPLLRDGNTRAVFSGNTHGRMKYAHEFIDGVHYFLNNTFPPSSLWHVKQYNRLELGGAADAFDNLMYVRVDGDEIIYRPFVVGAMNTDRSSWRYWESIKSQLPLHQRLAIHVHENIHRDSDYLWIVAVVGGAGLACGIMVTALWMWRRRGSS